MSRSLVTLLCTVAASLLVLCSAAQADVFGSSELASQGLLSFPGGSVTQQSDYARDPVISGDGRYVVFDGSFEGLSGIWRRDLQSGQLQAVAVGRRLHGGSGGCSTTISGEQLSCDAELPSISADGQYVSFTTTAALAPVADTNSAPDVYVRNMNLEASESESHSCHASEVEDAPELTQRCAYTLVSAVDGKDEGLTYVESSAGHGSVAGPRSAISADGRKVVFVTTAVSDLADPQLPGSPTTPASQVVLRNLSSRETELVSTRLDPQTGQPVPNQPVSSEQGTSISGAVYGGAPSFPFVFADYALTPPFGAAISADGSTVAWLGVNIGEQVRTLSGEAPGAAYREPLWRRTADGANAPTRAVSGGPDVENPACVQSGESSLPGSASPQDPCQGPFASHQGNEEQSLWGGAVAGNPVPQLSADGYTVAFLATAPLVSLGGDFGVAPETRHSDLYVADMHGSLTRTAALTPLTELASGEERNLATTGSILDLAISSDGKQVAFTTKRTEFPLGSPTYISAAAPEAGIAELFDVDLANQTLTRVTHGFAGGAGEHPHGEVSPGTDPYFAEDDGALAPSFSSDGNSLAFSSTASNLVYGDGNSPPQGEQRQPFDGSDAFVVKRTTFSFAPATQVISSAPAPAGAALTPPWSLGATASSQHDGSVLLYVVIPGAGALRAGAKAAVLVRAAHVAHTRSAAHGTVRRIVTRAVVASRTVASAASLRLLGPTGAIVMLRLVLASSYRELAAKRGGLSASVGLLFTAPGHPALGQSLEVTFRGPPPPSRHKRKSTGHVTGRIGGTSR
jgi:Tol biopolymer transport system component